MCYMYASTANDTIVSTNMNYFIMYPVLFSVATDVIIVSSPAGIPVNASTNTYDYSVLSSVVLTCMVNPSPTSTVTYQWNTTGCYTHPNFNNGNPRCFPEGLTTERVIGTDLTAEYAGTITCTVTINGMAHTSEPFTLRISGKQLSSVVTSLITSFLIYYRYCNYWNST